MSYCYIYYTCFLHAILFSYNCKRWLVEIYENSIVTVSEFILPELESYIFQANYLASI